MHINITQITIYYIKIAIKNGIFIIVVMVLWFGVQQYLTAIGFTYWIMPNGNLTTSIIRITLMIFSYVLDPKRP